MNTRLIKARLPVIKTIILLGVSFVVGCLYFLKEIEAHQRTTIEQQSSQYAESGRLNEIDAIRTRLRGVSPQFEQSCSNAVGFHHPEESVEAELARLRRVEACVSDMTKSDKN